MTSTPNLTADMLAELEIPHECRISPAGSQVVYTLRSDWNRPRGRWVSSIWVADVGKEISARKLTSGESNDSWPQWSPDGRSIAFLSDKGKEGVAAVWIMHLDHGKGPEPLTPTDLEKPVAKFAWSRDGKYIAYISADELPSERKAKLDDKDDAKVYGEYWEYGRLRVVEPATKNITTLVVQDRDVFDFTWSLDSETITYVTQLIPEYEIHLEDGSYFETVHVASKEIKPLAHVPGHPADLCQTQGDLWWRGNYEMALDKTARVVYKMSLETAKYERFAYGEDSCATPWGFPPGLAMASETKLAVQEQKGLSDRIQILPERQTIYDEKQELRSWDVVIVNDEPILTIVTSSSGTPAEIYSIVQGKTVRLSDHGKEIAKLNLATAEPFYAKAQDGTELDGVLVIPTNYSAPKPWPTIVLVHGGPYSRSTCAFDIPYFNWSAWFASQGYAQLSVNYRGGSSHGESYAGGVRGKAGEKDYSDMIDLVKAGVDQGIIDPDRVGVTGWSYGGYLAFLAVARDKTFHFQAAMCGAGLSDWDHTIMTSTGWRSAVEIAGQSPWAGGIDDVHNRKGSGLWQMQDIRTPVLILQGEDDPVVPVAQALGFHHGCRYYNSPCELVIYPREGHGIWPPFERLHYVDMLERMKRFFATHLKPDVKA